MIERAWEASLRFCPEGPPIPDELLLARDEGGVIFFCGAGVSRARAKLHDFHTLAGTVVNDLRADKDSPARKILDAATKVPRIPGVGSLVSSDRVFTVLAREFEPDEIRAAVARALKPGPGVDLSAHKMLLDLARGPDGVVRLVTTNFDRLFEDASGHKLASHGPPSLPDPARSGRFNGIIHLHGRVDEHYTVAEDDEFVLSSTDFGRAYVGDGWATQFIRGVMNRYQLVFVGYAADDPPVQYLLEALRDRPGGGPGLYAFQAGSNDEAQALWREKGVNAIAFDPADDYAALWRTLEGWAERARNPDAWYDRVLSAAMAGPAALEPCVRGQIKHIVSSTAGAKRFAAAAPPAEWLCTFDPSIRYADPPTRLAEGQEPFDPFVAYGLDDDPAPARDRDENGNPRARKRPDDAWDAFAPTRADLQQVDGRNHVSQVPGWPNPRAANLLPRLFHLGVVWLPKVADQPAAAWWAAGRAPLHADVAAQVAAAFNRATGVAQPVEEAWRLILRAQGPRSPLIDIGWFEAEAMIKRAGWSAEAVRQWTDALEPRLTVERPFSWRAAPPSGDAVVVRNLVDPSVHYPTAHTELDIPAEHLRQAVAETRRAFDMAIGMEMELGGWALGDLPPIRAQKLDDSDDSYGREHGPASLMLRLARLFERLSDEQPDGARAEMAYWPAIPQGYDRLRSWAAGLPSLTSPAQAAAVLTGLSDQEFWSASGQRDLLLSLRSRWDEFDPRAKARLERRILAGPPEVTAASDDEAKAGAVRWSLERLAWLEREGCAPTAATADRVRRLKMKTPAWREEASKSAADSTEMRVHTIGAEDDPGELLDAAPGEVLTLAKALSGRDYSTWVERRPFAGLSKERPAKALRALTLAHRNGEHPQAAWAEFLAEDARSGDSRRMRAAIAAQISRLPTAALSELMYAVSHWLERVTPALWRDDKDAFDRAWTAVLNTLREYPEAGRSSISVRGDIDWLMAGLNAPAGRLAQGLMNVEERQPTQEGFQAAWLERVSDLLELPGDPRRHAAVIFLQNLPWFYHWDRPFAEARLLSLLSGDAADVEAFWSGFFWSPRGLSAGLMQHLKPYLLALSDRAWTKHRHIQRLSAHLLAAWHSRTETGERMLNDAEMHLALAKGSDEFRASILSHLDRWSVEDQDAWRLDRMAMMNDVWPRQRSAKSPRVSAELVDLVLNSGEALPQVLEVVLPHIGPVKSDTTTFYTAGKNDELLTRYRDELITLLHASLAERAADWPYGAAALVERLAEDGPDQPNPLLVDLRRRLAAT